MPVRLTEENEGRTLVIRITGFLTPGDYEFFVPKLDFLMARYGKVRLLFELSDFLGWEVGALWQDTKFAIRHFRGVDRLAAVVEKQWQRGLKKFLEPFTNAESWCFDRSEEDPAREWLAGAAGGAGKPAEAAG